MKTVIPSLVFFKLFITQSLNFEQVCVNNAYLILRKVIWIAEVLYSWVLHWWCIM